MRRVGEKERNEKIEGSPATNISRAMIADAYAGEDKENQSSSIGVFSLTPELAAADNDPDVSAITPPCVPAVVFFAAPVADDLFTTVLVPMTLFRFETVDIPAACRAAFQIDCDEPLAIA